MTDRPEDIARILAPPPILFILCLGAGCLLHWLVPQSAPPLPYYARAAAGCLLIITSLLTGGVTVRAFRRCRTPVSPHKPTVNIVTSGPFRFSRNPLYCALLILYAGCAVLIHSLWVYLLMPFLFCLLHFGVVLREEQYLAGKFGTDYLGYKKSVRRWL